MQFLEDAVLTVAVLNQNKKKCSPLFTQYLFICKNDKFPLNTFDVF